MSIEYNKYLEEHRASVAKAFYWILDNIPGVLGDDPLVIKEYERQITANHDKSKSDPEEYDAYDEYYYGKDQSYNAKLNFDKAWLRHIHNNPHHWQYWILHNDDPLEGLTILDMPYKYIVEMICDWWSFGFRSGKLDEIFTMYNNHKDYIKLSDKTRKLVEYILKQIYDKLKESGDISNENSYIYS